MDSSWHGRYRGVVRALVHHSNRMAKRMGIPIYRGFDISLTPQEFQLLECVIENEDQNLNISDYSSITGINKSTLTVAANKLMNLKLVDKYKLEGNKKNVILKPTFQGTELYQFSIESFGRKTHEEFFNKLSGLSDEQLQAVEEAIMSLDKDVVPEQKLIKMDN